MRTTRERFTFWVLASIVTTNGCFGFFGLGSLMGVALVSESSVDARCVEAHQGLFELVVGVKDAFEDRRFNRVALSPC